MKLDYFYLIAFDLKIKVTKIFKNFVNLSREKHRHYQLRNVELHQNVAKFFNRTHGATDIGSICLSPIKEDLT